MYPPRTSIADNNFSFPLKLFSKYDQNCEEATYVVHSLQINNLGGQKKKPKKKKKQASSQFCDLFLYHSSKT